MFGTFVVGTHQQSRGMLFTCLFHGDWWCCRGNRLEWGYALCWNVVVYFSRLQWKCLLVQCSKIIVNIVKKQSKKIDFLFLHCRGKWASCGNCWDWSSLKRPTNRNRETRSRKSSRWWHWESMSRDCSLRWSWPVVHPTLYKRKWSICICQHMQVS